MPFVSDIDTGLPETPSIKNPDLYDEFLTVYNAIRALQAAFESGSQGVQGPQGFQGAPGDGSGIFVPYYIAPIETFVIPVFKQALWSVVIDNEGIIDVEGLLVEVD